MERTLTTTGTKRTRTARFKIGSLCVSIACFIFASIAIFVSDVSAQYRHTVHLEHATDVPNDANSGNAIQVYFATGDTLSLGYFADREGYGTSQALADIPLERWSNWYAKKKGKLSGKSAASYRWIVRLLSTTSDTSMGYLFTHLVADVLRGTSSGERYRWAASVDTVLSFAAGDSLPFVQALAGTMDLLYDVSVSSKDSNPKKKMPLLFGKRSLEDRDYTDSDLAKLSLSLSQENSRILTDTIYTKGVYRSFSEFLNNTPSVTGQVWIRADSTSGSGYMKLYRLGSDSSVAEVSDAWGICLGGHEIYKLESGRLVPLEKSGNGFVLSRYLDYRMRKNQALAWRMAVGSTWPNDNNPYERKRTETLRRFLGKNAPVATRLDLSSGELTF